ncbi:GNAT family N-acetyltransferase [Enterobacteriaceae bacterium H11S18]|uniref:GNAT family N-acetyltransferase n=1 Tax=Dryocola clanedunensis TaxID=2925396 RepID=UPI0022F131FD|nr:GNAT family N-acetyltransferase [Dryocola clanedunensis]MCT4710490.1 GNAT family N-acetyltransferase [Dryocola clanedunensis]
MITEAPDIETQRLTLRQITPDDFDELAACWADPEMVKFIGSGMPQSAEMTWGRLLRYIGHWHAFGYGYWAIFEKATGRYIGSFGFQDAHRDLTPALEYPEAGWSLIPAVHGKGYAKEALAAILKWADSAFDGPVCCIIDDDNHRSIHLAESSGFRFQHLVSYHGKQVRMFVRRPAR